MSDYFTDKTYRSKKDEVIYDEKIYGTYAKNRN